MRIHIIIVICGLIAYGCGGTDPDSNENSCTGPQSQACQVENGTGRQTRSCQNGSWGSWGACQADGCNAGYYLDNDTCRLLEPSASYEIVPDPNMNNLLEFTIDPTDLQPPLVFSIQTVRKAGIETALPEHIALAESNGTFSWTPTPSQSAAYDFTFMVTDALSASEEVIVHIAVNTPQICNSSSSACQFLHDQWNLGQTAGNVGDWYHNRDDFHTNLNLAELAQVDLMTDGYGAETALHPDRVVIGNSSTAYTTGESWMSQMRSIMLSDYRTEAVYTQYINNNHYWYPEHRDHDEKDHYHGKNAYVSSSQGSSGSEMDEVRNFFYTLAAFQPEVKKTLIETGLLMPTLQMIFRRVRVADDAEYLTGLAHPSAFDNYDGRLAMVEMANAIQIDTIPPMVQLDVIEENYTMVDGKREQWYTTPASVCRIFRGPEYTKRIVVSAANSYDINHRPLAFHWVLLRGEPAHVVITPQNSDGSEVEILIDYHVETTVAGTARLTNMVEVGAFVDNGVYYSAPGFVTDFTLNNEERTYTAGVLTNLQHNDNYVHPSLQ
jgi:hypothetical protein